MTDRVSRIILRGDISDLKAKLAAAGQSVKSFGDQVTANEKEAQKWRKGLDSVGNTARNVGLVAGVAFGAMVAKAATFDAAMSNVQAATHESAEAMGQLRQAALDAGADTAFSATQAAGAIENLAKAGISTQDILGGGLDGALSLAAAGSLEVADAAEIAATALTQFRLSGEDVPHVADLLAAGAGKAQGEVSDLSMALKQSGLVAAQMGVSIEETTGTLAAFASAGLLGSDAGTSFRTMLLRLANPTNESAKLMDRLGIAAYDAQGNFVGMQSVAEQLKTAFEGKTQAERDSALATIFGSDAIRAANVLYNEGAQGVQEWTNKVNDAGYAAETAAIKQDNLRGDIEKLTGALETLLITGGDGSQGFLRGATQNATDFVDALNKVPAPMKDLTGGLLAITAITGGTLWFGSKAILGVANMRQSLTDLGATADGTKGKLSALGKGVSFIALIAALNEVDSALDKTFNRTLDASNLTRSLDALAHGRTTGELLKVFGEDLEDFGEQVLKANKANSKIVDFLPDVVVGPTADAVNNIRDLDAALAGLVESGEEGQAAAIFERLAEAAAESDISVKELQGRFEQYNVALDNANPVTGFFVDSLGRVNSALTVATPATLAMGAAAQQAAADEEALAKALEESRKAAGETASEFFNLGASLNDSKVSLTGWIDDMRKSAQALHDFRMNARDAAENGLNKGLIASLQQAGPEGALRMQQLANATDAEIKRANQAWRAGQTEIRKYTNEVGGVPADKSTDLHLNTGEALSALQIFEAKMANATRDRQVRIITKIFGGQVPSGVPYKAPGTADGGTIPGQRSPYGDKMHAFLAPGEEVISNRYGQADRHRSLLKAINANRFADGGTVGRGSGDKDVSARGLIHEFGTLAKAIKALTKQIERGEKALSEETRKRDELVSKRDALSGVVAGKFDTDLFGKSSPWASEGSDWRSALVKDIAGLKTLDQDRATLTAKGLSGPALEALLQQANPSQIGQFAALPAAQLAEFAQLFQERAQLQSSVGQSAGNAVYGQAIATAAKDVLEMKQELRQIKHELKVANRHHEDAPAKTGAAVKKGVDDHAAKGKRGQR